METYTPRQVDIFNAKSVSCAWDRTVRTGHLGLNRGGSGLRASGKGVRKTSEICCYFSQFTSFGQAV